MGKNTDKLYITHSEWAGTGYSSAGGAEAVRKVDALKSLAKAQAQVPFYTCCISQQHIEVGDEMSCDSDGHVFRTCNLKAYLDKHGKNPVTGVKAQLSSFVPLKVTCDQSEYLDPITRKQFSTRSDAVVILSSGIVYLYETVLQYNVKANFWKDLTTDEPFTNKDIVHLSGGEGVGNGHQKSLVVSSQSPVLSGGTGPKTAQTTHHMASSVTSTMMQPTTQTHYVQESMEARLKPKIFTRNGFAIMQTNFGTMSLELEPKYSPKAVYNFVQLANTHYYDGMVFHRNVKHFMIQTGDPTGTGKGGESVFGHAFADETNSPMRHDSRGVVAMANQGKNTNQSQFFITYRRCPHLDGKHTVFGRVVDGLQVLDRLEAVPVGPDDRPLQTIRIESVRVVTDPFEDTNKPEPIKPDEADDSPFLRRGADSGSVGKYLKPVQPSRPRTLGRAKIAKATSLNKSSFAGW